jgi:hypothetical protein
LEGTDFAPHAEVFVGAWERIVRVIEKAGSMGIGVLIGEHLLMQHICPRFGNELTHTDLHAAAGGQNDDGN